ncbi:MAG: hypothetical protein MJ202_11175 [Lentisphaeria bacterium]|nr:hypothetical protein [Lentisphaeria bacterium]
MVCNFYDSEDEELHIVDKPPVPLTEESEGVLLKDRWSITVRQLAWHKQEVNKGRASG